jgi:hypothetical protein
METVIYPHPYFFIENGTVNPIKFSVDFLTKKISVQTADNLETNTYFFNDFVKEQSKDVLKGVSIKYGDTQSYVFKEDYRLQIFIQSVMTTNFKKLFNNKDVKVINKSNQKHDEDRAKIINMLIKEWTTNSLMWFPKRVNISDGNKTISVRPLSYLHPHQIQKNMLIMDVSDSLEKVNYIEFSVKPETQIAIKVFDAKERRII